MTITKDNVNKKLKDIDSSLEDLKLRKKRKEKRIRDIQNSILKIETRIAGLQEKHERVLGYKHFYDNLMRLRKG